MKIKSFKFLWAIFLFFIILNYNIQSFQKHPKYPFPSKNRKPGSCMAKKMIMSRILIANLRTWM